VRSLFCAWLIVSGLLCSAGPSVAAETRSTSCTTLDGTRICIRAAAYTVDVCAAISTLADRYRLPNAFFARLIWQESRFDPGAISPAGAQGIAQFMAGTARLRGLDNAFDPAEALAKSAEYLHELQLKYGNLGLAAAAYNAGEGRMTRVVNAGSGVPFETRNYVSIITGYPVDMWLGEPPVEVDYTLDPDQDFIPACVDMAKAVPMPEFGPDPAGWQPWGILIAQNFNRNLAVRRFTRAQASYAAVLGAEPMMLISVRNPNFGTRTRFSAMVGRPTQQEAQALCDALLAIGGNCIVQRNGP
jgi:transglycosylase-like protein with SLT domain